METILLFSCPEQLNRWPCHSLTDLLTKDFTNCDKKQQPNWLQTSQISDQSDEETCPDLQKDRNNDKDKDTYNKDTFWEFEILRTDR